MDVFSLCVPSCHHLEDGKCFDDGRVCCFDCHISEGEICFGVILLSQASWYI